MEPNSTHELNLQPPEFSEATLIVFANGKSTDLQIWESVRSLGAVGCRTQVLVVDPEARDDFTPSMRLSYRPLPRVFRNLTPALEAAKHPTVLVADPDANLSSSDWQWIFQRRQADRIQCYVRKNKFAKRYTQFLTLLFQLLLRWLLKTGKSRLTPGLVVLPKTIVDSVQPQMARLRDPSSPAFEVTALLALAKLEGAFIEDVELGGELGVNTVRSKSLIRGTLEVLQFWWNPIMFPLDVSADRSSYKKISRGRQVASTLVLLAATMGILFSNLGFPLFEPDEARNAQLAINVIESGDWLSLTLAGEPYWDKPPLQIWSIAASYQLFGVSPATTRLPSAFAAVLTVLFTVVLGSKLVGFRAAFIGAMLLLLSAGFLLIGRYVTMDASLTCWTTLTLIAFFLAVSRSNQNWLLVAGIGAGIGLLVKGPVILVLTVPPLLGAVLLGGRYPRFRMRQWLWFVVPTFLIAAPWFIATSLVHPDFLVYFFWKHHVVRFSDAFNHREPFWYYLPVIFLMMFPASYLLPSVAKFMMSRNASNRLLRTPNHGFLLLTAVWIVGFFSISESKLPTYILPALPSICLLMGVMLDKKIFSTSASGWRSPLAITGKPSYLESTPPRSLAQLAFLMLVFVGVIPFVFELSRMAVGLLASCAAVAAIATWVYRTRKTRQQVAWGVWAVVSAAVLLSCTHLILPSFSSHRSIHAAASYVRSSGQLPDAPVVFFGRENYGASLTLPKHQVHYFDAADAHEICDFLAAHPSSVIVASEDEMEHLRKWLSWKILLEKSEVGRHVYISRPNQSVIAEQPQAKRLR